MHNVPFLFCFYYCHFNTMCLFSWFSSKYRLWCAEDVEGAAVSWSIWSFGLRAIVRCTLWEQKTQKTERNLRFSFFFCHFTNFKYTQSISEQSDYTNWLPLYTIQRHKMHVAAGWKSLTRGHGVSKAGESTEIVCILDRGYFRAFSWVLAFWMASACLVTWKHTGAPAVCLPLYRWETCRAGVWVSSQAEKQDRIKPGFLLQLCFQISFTDVCY